MPPFKYYTSYYNIGPLFLIWTNDGYNTLS